MIDVFGVESDHGDSTVFHHMDVVSIDHVETLGF